MVLKLILEPVFGCHQDLATKYPMLVNQPMSDPSSYILPRDSQGRLRFNKLKSRAASSSSSAVSFPRTPTWPGAQYSPTACWVEISFNAYWHCWTNGDILMVWRVLKAAWLSEQILMCFSGLPWNWISWAHAKLAYISAWKTVAYIPREKLSLLPTDCP